MFLYSVWHGRHQHAEEKTGLQLWIKQVRYLFCTFVDPRLEFKMCGMEFKRNGHVCFLENHCIPFLYFRVIDTAASQLTKTAITVTAIFIVALGYDLWYYLLAYSGVTDYKRNTPLQNIGRYSVGFVLGDGGDIIQKVWVMLKDWFFWSLRPFLVQNGSIRY